MVECITLINTELDQSLVLGSYRSQSEYYILESVDWGTVKATFNTTHYVNQIGETLQTTVLSTRSVTIKGYAINWSSDSSSMGERKQIINKFVNPNQSLVLAYALGGDLYELTFSPTNTVKWSTKENLNNEVVAEFQIDGEAFDPTFFYYPNGEENILERPTQYGFSVPTILSEAEKKVTMGLSEEGLRTLPKEVEFYYTGDVPTGLKLTFTVQETSDLGLSIALVSFDDTGELVGEAQYLELDCNLALGDVIEINTNVGERSVTINGESAMHYLTNRSVWLTSSLGYNLVIWDGVDVEIYGTYNVRRLEVQDVR